MALKVNQSICLVGMMGAGKTTIGRELARELGLSFVDCDQEIVARTGVDVATIFDIEGEEGFRRRETQALEALLAGPQIVLATGGGVVSQQRNIDLLRAQTWVIYIEVNFHVLYERLRYDKHRPLLQVANPRVRIEQLLLERGPLYKQVAHQVIAGGRASPKVLARRLAKGLQE